MNVVRFERNPSSAKVAAARRWMLAVHLVEPAPSDGAEAGFHRRQLRRIRYNRHREGERGLVRVVPGGRGYRGASLRYGNHRHYSADHLYDGHRLVGTRRRVVETFTP